MSSKARALALSHRNLPHCRTRWTEAIMQTILAHFVTDFVRVTAFCDHVRIRSLQGSGQLFLYGQTMRNVIGNQDIFITLVKNREVTSIVGSTVSNKIEGPEGRRFSDLVVERITEDLYRIGYLGDQETASGILLEEDSLAFIVKACGICLTTGAQNKHEYDRDFWVLHASSDGDAISISSKIFEIIPEEGTTITIDADKMGRWLEIFSAAELLESLEPRSMIQVSPAISLYKCRGDAIHLKILGEDRKMGITADSDLFALCQRLMVAVWLGEDFKEEDMAYIDEDDDDDEGSFS